MVGAGCWNCCLRDPTPDKRMTMDGWIYYILYYILEVAKIIVFPINRDADLDDYLSIYKRQTSIILYAFLLE